MSTKFYPLQKDYIAQLNAMDDAFNQAIAQMTPATMGELPKALGTAFEGSGTPYARWDHVHPSTGPTAAFGTNSTALATTAYTQAAMGTRLAKSLVGTPAAVLSATEGLYPFISFTGAITQDSTVTVPSAARAWVIENNTTGAFKLTIKTAAGSGITVKQGARRAIYCDGTNVLSAESDFTGISLDGMTGGVVNGPVTVNDTGVNGANLKLIGDGATNPNKSIRAKGGNLEFLNSAYSAAVMSMTDAGVLTAAGFSGPLTGNVTGNVSGTAANVTGTVAAANGGTGLSAYTVGDILYASAANAMSKLAGVALGSVLISGGVGAAPAWGKVGLASHVSGTLAIANGGTGATTAAAALTSLGAFPAIGGTVTGDTTFNTNVSIGGNLSVTGILTANGGTLTVNSTTMTVDDPVITVGGDTAPVADDNKDKGVEFRWHNGTTAKVGFFGFDDSSGKFTFIPDATNTSEVFTGAVGTIVANLEGGVTGNLTGNADTASKLATARNINGVAFDGTSPITITANTTNTLTRGSYLTGSNFNGSAATTWAVDATSANTASKVVARDASGNFSAGTITANLTGDVTGNVSGNAANITGVAAAANGGTGQSSYTIGDILYASAANALSKLAGVAAGNALISGGVGAAPSWGKIDLTAHVSNTLGNANGGTGKSTAWNQWGVVYAASTTALANVAAGTSKQLLQSNGAAAPSWATLDMTYLPDAAFKKSVKCATTADLGAASFSAGVLTGPVGVLTVDGVSPALNDRVLVKNQTAPAQNGIYYVSTLGTGSVAWVLTRVLDGDTSSEISGAVVSVDQGTVQGGDLWTNTFKTSDTINTTAMSWFEVIDSGNISSYAAVSNNTNLTGTATIAAATFSGLATFNGKIAPSFVIAGEASGEGGQFFLEKPSTGSTLGGNITIDAMGNRIRAFDAGGTNKGFYVDLTTCADGATSELFGTHKTIPITNGGTGATTPAGALTALGAAPAANPTFTGTVNLPTTAMAGNSLSGPLLKNHREALVAASTTATYTADCSLANVFDLTLAVASTTIAMSNVPASGQHYSATFYLKQDATGSRAVTWPAGITWSSGTAPSLTATANKTDVVTLTTRNGGTTWFGFIGGLNF